MFDGAEEARALPEAPSSPQLPMGVAEQATAALERVGQAIDERQARKKKRVAEPPSGPGPFAEEDSDGN